MSRTNVLNSKKSLKFVPVCGKVAETVKGGDRMSTGGLSESLEDYLETILELQKSNKVARVKDIAAKKGVRRGTVTGALKTLAGRHLINYEPYSFITLTAKGGAIAREVNRRHGVIRNFLENVLLLDAAEAEENACRMEHAMDKSAIDRLVQFIEYIEQCPRAGDDWIRNFISFYSKNKITAANCPECIENCLKQYREENP